MNEYEKTIQHQEQAISSLRQTNRALAHSNIIVTETLKNITKQFCDVRRQNRCLAKQTKTDLAPSTPKLVNSGTQYRRCCLSCFTQPSSKRFKAICDAEHVMAPDVHLDKIMDIRETLICSVCRNLDKLYLVGTCGHSICRPCVEMIKNNLRSKCPLCNLRVYKNSIPNYSANESIESLLICGQILPLQQVENFKEVLVNSGSQYRPLDP